MRDLFNFFIVHNFIGPEWLVSFSSPIRCRATMNCNLVVRVFPRLDPLNAHWLFVTVSSALIGRCNYFGFWFYDTQYKTPQSVNVLNDIKSCSLFNLLGDYFSNMHRKPSLHCHFL